MIEHFTSDVRYPEDAFDPEDYNLFELLDRHTNSTRHYMLLLYSLVRSQALKLVVELGGFRGNTSLVLARAVAKNNGTLGVFEKDEKWAEHIRFRIHEAGLGKYVTIFTRETWDNQSWPVKADLVFVDADHTYDGVVKDWNAWSPKVTLGGYIAFHDALTSEGVNKFVHEMFSLCGWEHIGFPGDTGLVLVRRVH